MIRRLGPAARERGCRGMWAVTDEDNAAALRAYGKTGATIEERTLMLEWRLE